MKNSQSFIKSDAKNVRWITNTVLLILSLFIIASCGSVEVERTSTAQIVNTSEVREDTLEGKAKKLTELYDNKNCQKFFDSFPNNFEEFYQLYGFDEEKGANILFSETEHITYFFDCSEVSDQEKLKKVIKIGINGKWEADTIWMFQEASFKLIKNYPDETKENLDNLTDEKAASFWYFLFDGPHPTDKESVKKFDMLKDRLGKDSKQAKLLSEQFQKLEVDWKNH